MRENILDGVPPIQEGPPVRDSSSIPIGAVGVSGGTPDEDEQVAQAGIDTHTGGTR